MSFLFVCFVLITDCEKSWDYYRDCGLETMSVNRLTCKCELGGGENE